MEDIKKDETARRAELFDILAHPVRIRILKMLQQNSMSFSELKALGIESSGHLQYHLERLGDFGARCSWKVCGER